MPGSWLLLSLLVLSCSGLVAWLATVGPPAKAAGGGSGVAEKIMKGVLASAGVPREIFDPASRRAGSIRVLDDTLWRDLVLAADLGLGEGYMHEKWRTDDLPATFRLILLNGTRLGTE